MRNGRVFERHGHHLAPSEFTAATNRIRNFRRLTKTESNAAFFVAHDNQRAEFETASALHNFGGTINKDDFLDEFFAGLTVKVSALISAWTTSAPAAAEAAALSAAPAAAEATPTTTARSKAGGSTAFWSRAIRADFLDDFRSGFVCHKKLKLETSFTRRISERFDLAMKPRTAAIKHNRLDSLFDSRFGRRIAN